MSSLDLEGTPHKRTLARINRLPIVIIVVLFVVFSAVVIWGLAGRGIGGRDYEDTRVTGQPASDLAEAITQGVRPGIVKAPNEAVREPLELDPSPLPSPTNRFEERTDAAPSPDISQI